MAGYGAAQVTYFRDKAPGSRRSGELAEHQYALQIRTRGHEFLGHQIHAVVQAAYVAKIRGAIEAEDFRRLMMASEA